MSVPATRPTEISVSAWNQFSALPPASREAVWSAYSQGTEHNQAAFDREVSRFVGSTPQDRFAGMTAAGSGLNVSAARFGRVIPLRSETVPPTVGKALAATAGLDSTSGDAALAARFSIIEGITAAIV